MRMYVEPMKVARVRRRAGGPGCWRVRCGRSLSVGGLGVDAEADCGFGVYAGGGSAEGSIVGTGVLRTAR